MIHLAHVCDFVRDHIIEHEDGASTRRHEKDSERAAEHEPQRLAVSRTVMRRCFVPMRPVYSTVRASSKRRASRLRKSSMRRGACSTRPATRMMRVSPSSSTQTGQRPSSPERMTCSRP